MKRNQIKELIRLLLPPAIAAIVGGITASQFVEWMATTMGIATLVPILVEFIKTNWDITGKIWKVWFVKAKAARWITWGLCLVGILLSYSVGWGFQNVDVLSLLGNVLIAGFFANGYYKYDWVQRALAVLTNNIEKLKELTEKNK
jgi:hypothetical protein